MFKFFFWSSYGVESIRSEFFINELCSMMEHVYSNFFVFPVTFTAIRFQPTHISTSNIRKKIKNQF